MPRTWIVVPCYNEAERLDAAAFETELDRRPDLAFLFVNDGSGDGTADILDGIARRHHRAAAIHLERNGGKAEAVRQGMRLVCTRPEAEFVGFWDADLATPLGEIEAFERTLERRSDVEAVFGARLPLKGRRIRRRRIRQLLGGVFSFAASLCLGGRFVDTQCGAKLFRASGELYHVLERPFLARWIFDVEIVARWRQLRTFLGQSPIEERLFEQPLDEWHEVAGSKLKSGDFGKAALELTKIWRRHVGPGSDRAAGDWLRSYSPRTLIAERELVEAREQPPLRRAA
ncbi:MAG TPA: glycosyltransferase [Pirellulaceae bacterium]|jgi:glycosyltransferase involved in cell wall biosynthesis|nr:glycosyltransferase [Pirellulaceae bacterium]